LTQYWRVTDRQTDGHMMTAYTALAWLSFFLYRGHRFSLILDLSIETSKF